MTTSRSEKAWRRDADRLLRKASGATSTADRMALLARALLGRPYLCNPLAGGPGLPESLEPNLAGFDCVTFIESVLALARSRCADEFAQELVAMRYRIGKITWEGRLHYFTDWMRANERRGAIRNRTAGAGSHPLTVMLDLINGLPGRTVRLQVVPKNSLDRAGRRITDGSLIAFASLRRGLDFFHTGLVFWEQHATPSGRRLLLYHAPKSIGRVVMEPLEDFLARNRMRGVAFAAPCAMVRKEATRNDRRRLKKPVKKGEGAPTPSGHRGLSKNNLYTSL